MEPIDRNTPKREEGAAGAGRETPPLWQEAVAHADGVREPPRVPSLELGSIQADLQRVGFEPAVDGNIMTDPRADQSDGGSARVSSLSQDWVVTVADIGVHRFTNNRDSLRRLHLLLERSAVPHGLRVEDTPTSGLWLIDTPGELRDTLKKEGAQILVAVDKDERLLGLYIYHTGFGGRHGRPSPSDFAGADKEMIKSVLRSAASPIPSEAPFGVGHMVVIDALAKELADSAAGAPSRRDVLIAFQAAMITELRRHGIPWIVGYVRTEPAANYAAGAHAAMGWQEIPGCTTSYQYELESGLRCTVKNQVLALDVNSKRQDEIIAEARAQSGIRFLDLDRS